MLQVVSAVLPRLGASAHACVHMAELQHYKDVQEQTIAQHTNVAGMYRCVLMTAACNEPQAMSRMMHRFDHAVLHSSSLTLHWTRFRVLSSQQTVPSLWQDTQCHGSWIRVQDRVMDLRPSIHETVCLVKRMLFMKHL